MNYPLYNLFGKYPGNTYTDLVQLNLASSSLVTGAGDVIDGIINLSCSYAVSSSYEITTEISSSHADIADTASYVMGAVPNGVYMMGAPLTLGPTSMSGSITITNGIITAIQQAT